MKIQKESKVVADGTINTISEFKRKKRNNELTYITFLSVPQTR